MNIWSSLLNSWIYGGVGLRLLNFFLLTSYLLLLCSKKKKFSGCLIFHSGNYFEISSSILKWLKCLQLPLYCWFPNWSTNPCMMTIQFYGCIKPIFFQIKIVHCGSEETVMLGSDSGSIWGFLHDKDCNTLLSVNDCCSFLCPRCQLFGHLVPVQILFMPASRFIDPIWLQEKGECGLPAPY